MKNYDAIQLAKELADIRKRLDDYAAGSRGDKLANSSFQIGRGQGGIAVMDGSTIRGFMGQMPDGTVNSVSVNNTVPPSVPLNPIVIASIAGATVYARKDPDKPLPWDHSHFNVYVNDENIGTLQLPPDSLPIGPLTYDNPARVQLTSVNLSGTESDKTAYVYVTPLKVVGNDILDGVISTLKIANNAIKEANIDINAITETKIANNSISTLKIVSNAITSDKIIANAITSDKIVSNAITADKILVNTITGDKIAANTIDTGVIKAGAITASKLESNLVLATRIIAGNTEMNSNGFLAKNSSGVTTFSVDNSGNLLLQGTFRTALSGTRITINESNSNLISFYGNSGNLAGSIYPNSYTYSDGYVVGSIGMSVPNPGGSATTLQVNATNVYIYAAGGVGVYGFSSTGAIFQYRGGNVDYGFRMTHNGVGSVFLSSQNNTAIIFNTTGLDIIDGSSAQYRAVGASAFVVQSSETIKTNIRDLRFDALEVIKNAPVKMYEYKDDPAKLTNIGPMAEQMPSEAIRVTKDDISGVNLDAKIGIVWSATDQLIDLAYVARDRIVSMNKRIEALEKKAGINVGIN